MWIVALLAQVGRDDPLRRPEVIWGTIGLAVALLVGALVIWLVDRWRKQNVDSGSATAAELTDFRQMFERGEITEDEYVRLRSRVAQRVKAAPPPTGTVTPSDPTPPPTASAGDPAKPPPPV